MPLMSSKFLSEQCGANGEQVAEENSYEKKRLLRRDKFADHLSPMVMLSLQTGIRRGKRFTHWIPRCLRAQPQEHLLFHRVTRRSLINR